MKTKVSVLLPAMSLCLIVLTAGCTEFAGSLVTPAVNHSPSLLLQQDSHLASAYRESPGTGPDTVPQDTRDAYYRMVVRVPGYPNASEGMQGPSPRGLTYGSWSAAVAVEGYQETTDCQPNAGHPGNRSGQCLLNESIISVSNRLAGKEIMIGKYFETICPDYLAGMPESEKERLYNQTPQVPEIPHDSDGTVAFVPPLSVSGIRMEYSPGWAMTICGIAGFLCSSSCVLS
ncbi:MAG: hypothetical protein WC391_10040 [Methanoregula sp.]|jgi:hypothetical protein